MYDRVMVDCPNCGSEIEFQSKEGNLGMANYCFYNAPLETLTGIHTDIAKCEYCGKKYEVRLGVRLMVNEWNPKINTRLDFECDFGED